MNEAAALAGFQKVRALISNTHVVYASGRHGSDYVNKDAVYPHTELTSQFCKALAERFVGQGIDVCLGPALGGILLSQWTAFHLSALEKREVLSVYAEKEGEGFALRRGYGDIVRGKKTLVLEDVLTTGGSVKRALEALRKCDGVAVGVAALCNRGNVTAEQLGVPTLETLFSVGFATYDPAECPLCKSGVPINPFLGKGAKKS